MLARILAVVLAACAVTACASDAPEPIDLRQALRLKLIDESMGVKNADKRPSSLADIRINDVVINRSKALPSGDYDLWSDYGVTYRGQATRRSAVITLTREREEWLILSMRAPLP